MEVTIEATIETCKVAAEEESRIQKTSLSESTCAEWDERNRMIKCEIDIANLKWFLSVKYIICYGFKLNKSDSMFEVISKHRLLKLS